MPVTRRAVLALAAVALAGCSRGNISRGPPLGAGRPSALDLLDLAPAARKDPGALPESWEPFAFERIDRRTSYDVVTEDGGPALRARAEASASAVRRAIDLDARELPTIEWSWKVSGPVVNARVTIREGDDCAARIFILYRYEPERATLAERIQFAGARSVRGEYPPYRMLVYVWAEVDAPAKPWTSPLSDRVKLIAIERGGAHAGMWVFARRNHLEDYRAAFGEDPPGIEAVAFMADTDDTKSTVTAWLRGLRFTAP